MENWLIKMSEQKYKWRIIHDDGAGVTEESLKVFRKAKGKLGRIYNVYLNDESNFNFQIEGENGWLLLSGCSCGYGGTGPHGAVTILKELGIKEPELSQMERDVFSKERLYYSLNGSVKW